MSPVFAPAIGTLKEIRHYPVKSMRGQNCDQVEVFSRGLAHDRLYAVYDANGKMGSGKNTRRFAIMHGLMEFTAERRGQDIVVLSPDQGEYRVDDSRLSEILSARVGRAVVIAGEGQNSHFDSAPIHIVSTADLAWLSRQTETLAPASAMRPNFVIQSHERATAWEGKVLRLGEDVALEIFASTERCLMVDWDEFGQRTDCGRLRAIAQKSQNCFGVYARVKTTGFVALADCVAVV